MIQQPVGTGAGALDTETSDVTPSHSGSVDSLGTVPTETSYTARTSLDLCLTAVGAEFPELLFANRLDADDSSENESISHESNQSKKSIASLRSRLD